MVTVDIPTKFNYKTKQEKFMAKFVCCGLILEATILKKETKFITICGLYVGNTLIDRDIRWIVTADTRLLNLTIKHHNIEICV